jgi:hypothetical protein
MRNERQPPVSLNCKRVKELLYGKEPNIARALDGVDEGAGYAAAGLG